VADSVVEDLAAVVLASVGAVAGVSVVTDRSRNALLKHWAKTRYFSFVTLRVRHLRSFRRLFRNVGTQL
jgi:hypothetical protein